MNRNLVIIASYPKSGSTWLRVVFDALRRGSGRAVSINDLDKGFYGAWRRLLFDDVAAVNSSDLLPEEIDDELPHVFRRLAAESAGRLLIKSHDAAFQTPSGEWLYPPECVRAVICLVRHPFDVAVSYAHHLALPVAEAVASMGRDEVIGRTFGKLRLPLHERAGSWSGNIQSWLDGAPYDVTLARYEDLHADPIAGFRRLAMAAGFAAEDRDVAHAVDAARFDRLRSEEKAAGFEERPRTSAAFFRAGHPLSWQGLLDETLRSRLMQDHGAVMKRLGYSADGHAAAIWDAAQRRSIA